MGAAVSGDFAPVVRSSLLGHAAAQAAMQPWIDMECLQIGSGQAVCRMETIDFGSQQVVQENQLSSVQKIGKTPANLCTLSYFTSVRSCRFSEHGNDHPDTAFFLPGNTEFDLYVSRGTGTAYISFDHTAFLRDARILDPRRWEVEPVGVRSWRSPLKHAFAMDLAALRVGAENACGHDDIALIRKLLLQSALQLATHVGATESISRAARARSFAVCKLARAYIRSCDEHDALPSIVDICLAIGVSERRLQYAFQEYVGMSPNTYLRLMRLNRVRAALVQAVPGQTTVTRIAVQHGFLHFGRFAGDYKRIFGEPPSVTLAS